MNDIINDTVFRIYVEQHASHIGNSFMEFDNTEGDGEFQALRYAISFVKYLHSCGQGDKVVRVYSFNGPERSDPLYNTGV